MTEKTTEEYGPCEFRILLVDDEPEIVMSLEDLLSDEGYSVVTAGSGQQALERLEAAKKPFDLVVTDLRMPPPDGLELLKRIKAEWPATEVILLTAFATRETAREALRQGVLEYIEKPYKEFEMALRTARIFEQRRLAHGSEKLAAEKGRLEQERDHLARRVEALEESGAGEVSFKDLVARSEKLKEVFYLARKVAATDATILIRGASGTGKSALARAVHQVSTRADGPFLKVNCGALPESLLESELFGHEKGAFTGAIKKKDGLFLTADGGTIFLDEIGDISLGIQLKLLQVLEEKTFLAVGGNTPISVDVRVITATNRELEAAIEAGDFRGDLFYRLNVFPIMIPPLRERPDDIAPLVERFLKLKHSAPEKISAAGMKALLAHPLPGNVRELENIIERALILAGSETIGSELIPPPLRVESANLYGGIEIPDEGIVLEELEKELIRKAIFKAGGNKTKAATLLGLTRRTLYSRMERYGIEF
jgi:DNA-binding NtrC family response regulator